MTRGTKFMVGVVITAVVGGICTWIGVNYGSQILNRINPNRKIVNITALPAPRSSGDDTSQSPSSPPTSTSSPTAAPAAKGKGQETRAYALPEQYAFSYRLTPAEIEALNAVEARAPIGATTVSDESARWIHEHKGADVLVTKTRLVLQALDQPLRIVGMKALVIQKSAPLTTSLLHIPPEGEEGTIQANINLDEGQPEAHYFSDHTISLKPGESVAVDLTATARKYNVTWDVGIDVLASNIHQVVTAHSQFGGSFRTTGPPPRTQSRMTSAKLYEEAWEFDTSGMMDNIPSKFQRMPK